MRDMVLADDDLHVHSKIVRMAENLNHSPHGAIAVLRKFQHLDVHNLPIQVLYACDLHRRGAHPVTAGVLRRDFHSIGNLDPLLNSRIVRNHEVAARANAKFPHDRSLRVPENSDDLAVGLTVVFNARNVGDHPVAVHRFRGSFAGYEDVSA